MRVESYRRPGREKYLLRTPNFIRCRSSCPGRSVGNTYAKNGSKRSIKGIVVLRYFIGISTIFYFTIPLKNDEKAFLIIPKRL
jgi:hypothetical protein